MCMDVGACVGVVLLRWRRRVRSERLGLKNIAMEDVGRMLARELGMDLLS